MFNFLIPDYYYHSIHDVDLSFFKELNIKGVLFDIDNTLEPYETIEPSEKTIRLFENLRNNGINVAVISNNHEERVKRFCSSLDVEYSFDSGKPSSKKILQAIERMGLKSDDVIIVGDQLFTDVWAGNNTKIKSMFVDRINNKESFFIKVKRLLELPIVAKIKKNGEGKIK